MQRKIAVLQISAGLIAAFGALILGNAPSGAQDYVASTAQELPWYMPQPWVAPPQTGPKFRPLSRQYGHNYPTLPRQLQPQLFWRLSLPSGNGSHRRRSRDPATSVNGYL